jgi:signal transduction histidine kinase
MNLKRYLKDSIRIIVCFVIIVSTVDLVLISSTPINKSIWDIVYMNILILAVSLVFLFLDYAKWKASYKEFKEAIDNNKEIDAAAPTTDTFEAELIRNVLELKNNKMYNKTKELENLLDEINDYITKWVHEIKIPISVCELIVDRIAEEDSIENYNISEDIRKELERIKFLVDQVLYIGRASSYSEDFLVNEVNLEGLVKGVVRKNAYSFISQKIDLKLGNLDFNVMTDKKWTIYILDQIINNACKYIGDKGKIEVSAYEDEKAVRLSIKDNGTGILPKDINRIFDKGFTGDNGRKTAKSTGMGLYLCRKMTDRLNHDIEAESQVGQYTEFTIIFYKLSDYFMI